MFTSTTPLKEIQKTHLMKAYFDSKIQTYIPIIIKSTTNIFKNKEEILASLNKIRETIASFLKAGASEAEHLR